MMSDETFLLSLELGNCQGIRVYTYKHIYQECVYLSGVYPHISNCVLQNLASILSRAEKIGAAVSTDEFPGNKNIKMMFHKREEDSEKHPC